MADKETGSESKNEKSNETQISDNATTLENIVQQIQNTNPINPLHKFWETQRVGQFKDGFVLGLVGQEKEGASYIVMACNVKHLHYNKQRQMVTDKDNKFVSLNNTSMLMCSDFILESRCFEELSKQVQHAERVSGVIPRAELIDRCAYLSTQFVFGDKIKAVLGGWSFNGYEGDDYRERWTPYLFSMPDGCLDPSFVAIGAGVSSDARRILEDWSLNGGQSLDSALKVMEQAARSCYQERLSPYFKVWFSYSPLKQWTLYLDEELKPEAKGKKRKRN